MKSFKFSLPTNIVFGKDSEQKIGEYSSQYGKNALILYGSNRIKDNGLFSSVIQYLDESNIKWSEFGGIKENATLSKVKCGINIIKEKNIDLLIAVGGGSVIDSAKAMSIGAFYEGDILDLYERRVEPKKCLPIGVILTSSATASEVNCISVILNEETKKKLVFNHTLMHPKFALMNPELTYSLSKYQTAVGAIDIFAHAFERYFHLEQQGTLRDYMCESVMKTVIIALPKTLKYNNDYKSRSEIMWAATVAHSDIIGSEGDFACHELSHIFTEELGITHGGALAIIMPAWCKFMMNNENSRLVEFFKNVWGIKCNSKSNTAIIQEGIAVFQDFICKSGLHVTLREAGINYVDSYKLAKKAMGNNKQYIGGKFKKLYIDDIKYIIELAKG